MTTGSADPELHRSIVQVLVSEYERSTPPRGIKGVSRKVLAAVWGFYAQINRLGRALLVLIDNGMGHETHILARVAVEHAILLHWVEEISTLGVRRAMLSLVSRRAGHG